MMDEKREAGTGQYQEQHSAKLDAQAAKHISLPPALTVKQLGELLEVNAIDIIKQLMRNGLMANINQTIDFNVASVIAENFGFKVKRQPSATKSKAVPTPVAKTERVNNMTQMFAFMSVIIMVNCNKLLCSFPELPQAHII